MRFLRRHPDAAELGLTLLDQADAATTDHLASCAVCKRRQSRLASRLTSSRAGAHAAADAAFPADVLERQRAAILQRIARAGSARVLTFPRTAVEPVAPPPPLRDSRWIVAAAAAGLILGVAVGQLERRTPPAASAPVTVAQSADASPAVLRDDTLLSDVDEALSRDVRPEFGALDGLTPIVYETR
jgi:hypothetical protein